MSTATVKAAFNATLTANWTATTVVGLNGVTVPPDDLQPFLVVQYPISDASKPILGRRFFQEGAARLVINTPSGMGEDEGFALSDELASLFREKKLGNGVETFAPSAPIVNDANDEGNWFSLSVIVPYRCQFDDGGSNSPA